MNKFMFLLYMLYFCMILFLMMISGLLIIFLYFSSLISNEQFNLKLNFLYMYMMMMNLSLLFFFIKNISIIIYKYQFNESNPIMKINLMNWHNIMNIYEYPLNNMSILSMFYLLVSLFSIIKICSMKFFSMRKIN